MNKSIISASTRERYRHAALFECAVIRLGTMASRSLGLGDTVTRRIVRLELRAVINEFQSARLLQAGLAVRCAADRP